MAIDLLKNKVGTFEQVKKLNEIIHFHQSLVATINDDTTTGLMDSYKNQIADALTYLNTNVNDSINKLKKFFDDTIANYYTKSEADDRYLNEGTERNLFMEYNNPVLNNQLRISVGNEPAIKFTKQATLKFGDVEITSWPFTIKKNGKRAMEVNLTGLITDKTIVTRNTYHDFVTITDWKDANNTNGRNNWHEMYIYNKEDGPLHLIKGASLRGHEKDWADDVVQLHTSCGEYRYTGHDKNHHILSWVSVNDDGSERNSYEIWRQRRKHHSSYKHKWERQGGTFVWR